MDVGSLFSELKIHQQLVHEFGPFITRPMFITGKKKSIQKKDQ